jgi:hypothetical protein
MKTIILNLGLVITLVLGLNAITPPQLKTILPVKTDCCAADTSKPKAKRSNTPIGKAKKTTPQEPKDSLPTPVVVDEVVFKLAKSQYPKTCTDELKNLLKQPISQDGDISLTWLSSKIGEKEAYRIVVKKKNSGQVLSDYFFVKFKSDAPYIDSLSHQAVTPIGLYLGLDKIGNQQAEVLKFPNGYLDKIVLNNSNTTITFNDRNSMFFIHTFDSNNNLDISKTITVYRKNNWCPTTFVDAKDKGNSKPLDNKPGSSNTNSKVKSKSN